METHAKLEHLKVSNIMTLNFYTIGPDNLLLTATKDKEKTQANTPL